MPFPGALYIETLARIDLFERLRRTVGQHTRVRAAEEFQTA
jgi:hypothetical protein